MEGMANQRREIIEKIINIVDIKSIEDIFRILVQQKLDKVFARYINGDLTDWEQYQIDKFREYHETPSLKFYNI